MCVIEKKDPSALEPHITKSTIEFHYGRHHANYVRTLNNLAKTDNSLAAKTLEGMSAMMDIHILIYNHTHTHIYIRYITDLIQGGSGPVFNNAGEIPTPHTTQHNKTHLFED